MSENETPHSGSRWEPGAAPQPSTPQPVYGEAAPPAPPAKPGRGRLALAAAAVGLVAAGGIGGFVVGQASAGNASETGVVQNGVPGEGRFPGGTRPDFGGNHDGDGGQGIPPGAADGTG